MEAMAVTGGGGGGPAPFLMKTYDMVDDNSTDPIVSWSPDRKSFVVWDPPEFARVLLPTYFKHNNFSSFIRQLNTYGFRKMDPERWEFGNEDFVKDQKHLLKNIHRRKPIHSHSNPQISTQGDSERAVFEEEIEKLSREKAKLENNLLILKQKQSAEKLQLEDSTVRISSIEHRQENLLAYLEKNLKNQSFVELLAEKLEAMDMSAYSKKRRLPQAENSRPIPENSFVDNNRRPEFGNIYHQDFPSKLTLELSPATSDINFVSRSTQSSNEDNMVSPQRGTNEDHSKDSQIGSGGVLFAPETLELSDTGTSFTFLMDSTLSRKVSGSERSLQQTLTSNEESDALVSCHLNLTLASSPLPVIPLQCNEVGKSTESRPPIENAKDSNLSYSQEEPVKNTPPVQGNDMFWEQFLTERPGCSEAEEANSTYKGNNAYDNQDDRRSGHLMSRNAKGMENLTL